MNKVNFHLLLYSSNKLIQSFTKPKYLNYSLNYLSRKSTEFYMNTGEAENRRTNLFGRWRHQSTLRTINYFLSNYKVNT